MRNGAFVRGLGGVDLHRPTAGRSYYWVLHRVLGGCQPPDLVVGAPSPSKNLPLCGGSLPGAGGRAAHALEKTASLGIRLAVGTASGPASIEFTLKRGACIMEPMTIAILKPGDEAALETFLLPRVDSSMFLIGNMRTAGLVDQGGRFEGTYAAAREDDRIVSVVAHYWNGNLVFQAPVQLDALWRAAVRASDRPVRRLLGPANQVEEAAAALPVKDGDVQLDETATLYSLDLDQLIVPLALESTGLAGRRIAPRDVERVARWTADFSIESLGEEDTPELLASCRLDVEQASERGTTWILEDQGAPVAISSFNTAIEEAVQIGGVWTPVELRGRGYGRAVVAVSLLDAGPRAPRRPFSLP